MKLSSVIALIVMAGGCVREAGPDAVDRQALRKVTLPDLSRLEESVQTQLRGRYASLEARRADASVPAGDLANEYGEMGMLLLAAEFLDPAEAALVDARTLAPGDLRWHYYLGHVFRMRGDLPNAMAAFERGRRVDPSDVPTMIALGEAALDQGRPDAAEPVFAKAQSLDPRSAAALYGLGRAALARKDYALAARHLEQALALDRTASIIHYSAALAYRGLGDADQARQHLQLRGSLPIRPDALRKALDEVLDSALAHERNADAAGNRGDWADAAAYLREAIALAPARAPAHHKLGTALFYLKDRRGAVEQFHEAVRLSPGFVDSLYALGVVHEEDGDHRQAIDAYSAALATDPMHVEARLGLANELRRGGAFERALIEYDRALKIDPGAVRARFGYAAALVRLNRYVEARDRLAEAMDLYPNELAFARAAARVLAAAPDDRVRDGSRALAIARTLQGRQPQTIELAATMAMAAAETGRYADAVQWQRQAIDAAGKAGRRDVADRLTENLMRYQAGRPCRTPWRPDERIEFWL